MIFFFYVSYVLCARVFAMQSVFNLIKVKQNLNFFFFLYPSRKCFKTSILFTKKCYLLMREVIVISRLATK